MATKNENKNAPAVDTVDPFAQFMPEGYSASDNKKVGGLTPIYAAGPALEEKWPPVIGLMVGIDELDMGEKLEGDQRHREFLLIESRVKTKAVTGNKIVGHKIVDIEPGMDVYVPMTGNIKNIKTIRALLADPKHVYLGCFLVTGTMPSPKGNDMWVIDTRINSKKTPREGRFVLPPDYNINQLTAGGVTASGQQYDRDGVLQNQGANA